MDASTIAGVIGTALGACAAAWQAEKAKQAKAQKDQANALKEQAEKTAERALGEASSAKTDAALKDVHQNRVAELEAALKAEMERAENDRRAAAERYDKNQDFHHKQASTAQATLWKCQEECASLKATRDFGPILAYIQKQDEDRKDSKDLMKEVFNVLRQLSHSVDTLNHNFASKEEAN